MLVLALYLGLTRRVSWGGMVAMVAPILAVGAYIGGFYVITHIGTYNFPGTGQRIMLQSVIPHIGELRTLVNIALGVLVNFGVYFMGYALLVLVLLLASRQPLMLLKERRVELVWFAASLLVAAIARTLAHHFLDGFQFFSNPMVPFTPIILSVLLAASLRHARSRTYALTVLVLVGLLLVNSYKLFTDTHPGHVTTRYSPAFLRQMAQVLPTLGARGGYLLADAEYVSSYTLSSNSYTAGNYVSNFKDDYALISLSALDPDSLTTDPRFVRDSAQAEQIVRESTLFRFAKFQALQRRASSLDSMKYQLVREAGLSFICTSRIPHWKQGFRLIIGNRQDRQETGWSKRMSQTFHWLMKHLALRNIPDGGFDFVFFDQQVRDDIVRMQERNSNIFYLMVWLGYSYVNIPYVRRKREIGKSRWTLQKKLKLFIDSLLSFSFFPIRVISVVGLLLGFAALLFGIYTIGLHIFAPQGPAGWTTLMVVVLFVSAFQMIALGIIGEYVWRGMDAARSRPLYVVKQVYDTQQGK